jgi:iron complex transport system ATP-binding protein
MSSVLHVQGVELAVAQRVLVRGLDLAIGAGERWVILGPNGAGKSTLLATLAGVRRAQAGAVLLDGRPLDAFPVLELAERRALVIDRWTDPFAARVLDTVLTARFRFGGRDAEARERALQCLAELDVEHLQLQDVRSLSRGERQRVAIATAAAQDTPLLLLDEPIAHQDPRHQAWVIDWLRAQPRRTVVASLHDMNAAARLATHALLLDGRGGWEAGAAHTVLSAERLSRLFSTPVAAVQVGGATRFVAAG